MGSGRQDTMERLPNLFNSIALSCENGFGNSEDYGPLKHQNQRTADPVPSTSPTEYRGSGCDLHSSTTFSPRSADKSFDSPHAHHISICLPPSPSLHCLEQAKLVILSDESVRTPGGRFRELRPNSSSLNVEEPKPGVFHSLPMSSGRGQAEVGSNGTAGHLSDQQRNFSSQRHEDLRYEHFKTWSGKLERQLSQLIGRPQAAIPEGNTSQTTEIEPVPVDRYFDALEGPELETLKPSEELVLPNDNLWPFLMRFPISAFGICLGMSSQANLWKVLSTCQCTNFLNVSPIINLVLWCISLALTIIIAIVYSLKVVFFFKAVRREYYHPIRVNFFFAPWVACLFLAMALPPQISKTVPHFLWYMLMTPILCLELKIYGQWMSGTHRRLSMVANPSNHLSIVGNFVGALLGASMGLKEGPIFFFAVGVAHYVVLFVTLYQRLPTNETLPKELHPVFFLFVAAPSVASMAWARLQGEFDYGARIGYFISLFLYLSLAFRINFFRGFRFSLAWWAYTFPMTGAAIATIRYAVEIETAASRVLATILSVISAITVSAVLVTTLIHACVLGTLFPNDVAIAICQNRATANKLSGHASVRPGAKDLEASLRGASTV